MSRRQPFTAEMNGGTQLSLFTAQPDPEPAATAAGPAHSPATAWARAHGLQLDTGAAGLAVLSPCGTYRYWLERCWDEQAPPLVWVMLNPSTADAGADDATIRRCIQMAKTAQAGGIRVVNLFALRSRDPEQLRQHADPIGPHNDQALTAATDAPRVVVAWGDVTRQPRAARAVAVAALLAELHRPLVCLGLTVKHHPRHPLYVRAEAPLVPFTTMSSTEKDRSTL